MGEHQMCLVPSVESEVVSLVRGPVQTAGPTQSGGQSNNTRYPFLHCVVFIQACQYLFANDTDPVTLLAACAFLGYCHFYSVDCKRWIYIGCSEVICITEANGLL